MTEMKFLSRAAESKYQNAYATLNLMIYDISCEQATWVFFAFSFTQTSVVMAVKRA